MRDYPSLAAVAALSIAVAGCASEPEAAAPSPDAPLTANMPELGSPIKQGKGLVKYEVHLPREKPTNHLWIYVPEPQPKSKMPIVLIAPGGSGLFRGIALRDDDEVEHVPYSQAGFVVVAYELDGDVGLNRPTTQQALAASRAYKDSKGGLLNERDALNYALAKVPNVDPNRVYMVGHSSAGAHALLMASQDSRIRACVAYAPVTKVPEHIGAPALNTLSRNIEGFSEFATWTSPDRHLDTLNCPVMIFQAKDDSAQMVRENMQFHKDLLKVNKQTVLKLVENGGHFDSMVNEGIPAGIKWLKSLDQTSK
jgi:dipeptidyl aminopeptidase/acylaminoacyl peptidase